MIKVVSYRMWTCKGVLDVDVVVAVAIEEEAVEEEEAVGERRSSLPSQNLW
jgi:hypothetical protein